MKLASLTPHPIPPLIPLSTPPPSRMQLWRMYGAAIKEAGADGTQTSLRILRNITVVFWSVFPLVWVLVQVRAAGWVDEWVWGGREGGAEAEAVG